MHRCGTAGGGLGGSHEEVFCGCWVVAVVALVGESYQDRRAWLGVAGTCVSLWPVSSLLSTAAPDSTSILPLCRHARQLRDLSSLRPTTTRTPSRARWVLAFLWHLCLACLPCCSACPWRLRF